MKSLASTARALLALPLATAFLLGSLASAQTTTSAVPGLLSYQGKVTNAAGAAVGAATSGGPVNRKVTFRIWSHQSNGTPNDLVYAEEQTVTISEGEFSVLLGQGTAVAGTPLGYSETAKGPPNLTVASPAVFGGPLRYLGVTVDDGTAAADPEVSPRQQLVTSGYAFRAKYAESVGANGVNSLTALDNGNIGIGSASPGAKLEVAGNIRAGGAGVTSPVISLLANSASAVALSVGYASTAGLLSTNAAAGDSVMRTDNGGKLLLQSGTGVAALTINSANQVGIGQPNPGFPLNFASTLGDKISLSGNSGAHYGFGVQSNLFQIHADVSAADIGFGYGSSAAFTELMRLKGTGNVGIGTSTPGAKLDVNGSIRAAAASGFIFGTGGDLDGGLFSPADGVVTLKTNATERVRVDASGNVGIGTTSPAATLDVNGSVRAAGGSGFTFSGADTDGGLFSPSDGVVTLRTNGSERVRVDASGNVGIGITTATAPLSFSSNIGQKVSFWTSGAATYGIGLQSGLLQIHTGGSGDDIAFGYGSSGSLTETMRIKGNGTVGIGTSNPTQAKLVVSGVAGAETIGNHGSLSTGGATNSTGSFNIADASIRATGAIHAIYFRAVSDARIKRIQGRSDGAADLALLNQIEITNYTYIDRVAHGGRPNKRLIGQQVESVFPQAVSRTTDVIADIYKLASLKDGWVELATDLKPGERVRLLDDKAGEIYDVLEVQANRFRTNYPGQTDKVFVYGREVKDFRVVDYEAVAMLNVSATQQLKREKDAEIAALRQRVAELEAKELSRDAKLASIEKLLQSSQTVMARPASAPRANASGQD